MQTILFFLDKKSVCNSVLLVCDNSLMDKKIKELDSAYKKTGKNIWTGTRSGRSYILELKNDDLTFNITIRQKE
jgi:hypothetical protein